MSGFAVAMLGAIATAVAWIDHWCGAGSGEGLVWAVLLGGLALVVIDQHYGLGLVPW